MNTILATWIEVPVIGALVANYARKGSVGGSLIQDTFVLILLAFIACVSAHVATAVDVRIHLIVVPGRTTLRVTLETMDPA